METKEALKNSKHTLRDRQRMKGGERERAGGVKEGKAVTRPVCHCSRVGARGGEGREAGGGEGVTGGETHVSAATQQH